MIENPLNPSLSLEFYDLYRLDGLNKIDRYFHEFFADKQSDLYQKFCKLKNNSNSFNKKDCDFILLESAKILEQFLAFLFNIEKEHSELISFHQKLSQIPLAKKDFVQRVVAKKYRQFPQDLGFEIDGFKILAELNIDLELIFSGQFKSQKIADNFATSFFNEEEISYLEAILAYEILDLLNHEVDEKQQEKYQKLIYYAVWALYSQEGKKLHQNGSLFKLPQKIDYDNLVVIDKNQKFTARDDFNLTDRGFNLNQTLAEANYCIFCHNQEKDSCRKGLCEPKDKTKIKKNPLDIKLEGCPLDQKISEMNLLKSEFFTIASIAVAMIENPLLAGTGHRICNDCMKSCIFQKQDPVDIPQIESRSLKDLLSLPYGFEIYSLLTRWNPLKFGQELPKENSGKKILVAGLGPAGYSLSHYLLNQGHLVIAVDGLKIEPLNPEISGIDQDGNLVDFKPIKSIDDIYQPLQTRLIQGFGGVAEYGITSRWDKNFLTIIRLLLERRKNFRMFGGIRFGSSIDDKIAFDKYDFDHIALCIGAGKPNIIDIKNNFAKGIRSSSDFLMSLQLTGAFKKDLFTNLQIRQPIIVVGAGLTGVDTASEAQEYYILQIQRFYKRYHELSRNFGEEHILAQFNQEEKNIAQEFLDHYQYLVENGKEKFLDKFHAKILYRKNIQSAPSYRLNHEELKKALEQKIEFIENEEPQEAILDDFSYLTAIRTKSDKIFDCKTLLVAVGTVPNISIKTEDNLNFDLRGKYFKQIDENYNEIKSDFSPKSKNISFFTRIDDDSKAISFFGDLHPNFEGNVVKAMASAKIGYKEINKILSKNNSFNKNYDEFLAKINQDFVVKIHKITKISKYVNEIEIKAPILTNKSEVGHIFRLQNYHANAIHKKSHILAMEGVAVTALKIDRKNGIITGIITDYGGSTSFIKNFKENEKCVFMGPSGTPTEITGGETVLLIGGGRGNMPLTVLSEAFRSLGSKVIFVASYRKNEFVFRQERMEKAPDILVYAVEEEPKLKIQPNNYQFQGNVIEVLKKYFALKPEKIDRILAIGNDKMMAQIAKIRYENIIPEISQAKIAITSLNSSMQCMMKGVCSQCLQKRRNDKGEFEYFYACTGQDQDMDKVDYNHLTARCDQNSLQEKMTKMWIEYISS